MRLALPLMTLLFTAGPALAGPAEAPPKAAAPAKVAMLRFAWPTPSRVTVTERVLKKGKSAVMRYDAVLSARQGGGYELKIDKLQFLELEGREVPKGELPPELKAATALASAIPVLIISKEGEVQDVVGFEDSIERALAQVPEEQGMREQLRKVLAQPVMAQAMKQKAGEFWNAWVGAWTELELAEGHESTGPVPVQLPAGPVDSLVTIRHRGPDAAHKGAVRLELETVLEGEPFRKAMVGLVAQMVQAAGAQDKAPPDVDAMLKSARRVSKVEAVTDAATLRPYSVRMSQVTKLQMENQEREQREVHEYSFDWPAPKAAGKSR
jgi:hypothetical protein